MARAGHCVQPPSSFDAGAQHISAAWNLLKCPSKNGGLPHDIAWIATAVVNESATLEAVDALVAGVTNAVEGNEAPLAFDVARAGNTPSISMNGQTPPETSMRHAGGLRGDDSGYGQRYFTLVNPTLRRLLNFLSAGGRKYLARGSCMFQTMDFAAMCRTLVKDKGIFNPTLPSFASLDQIAELRHTEPTRLT